MATTIDAKGLAPGQLKADLIDGVKRGFGRIMSDAVAEIVLRARSGRDTDDSQFLDYSKDYKERKAKSGRNSGTVDLTFSGLMLASIQQRVFQDGENFVGLIYFSSPVAAARAQGNIDYGRDFFGLSKEQQERIYEELQGLINI